MNRRIPSLDGLRAVSIAFVIFSHLEGTRHFLPIIPIIGDLGQLGVRVFFIISGFLITTLLLNERTDTGKVSVPWFYFRRTLRIFPAAYAFIGIVFVLHKFGLVPLHARDMIHSLTYTMNYYLDRSWNVGHLWSLAVEEQFYILWAIGFAVLAPGKALWFAIAAIIIAPLARTGMWIFLPAWRDYVGLAFPTVCDSLAAGCVLALLRKRLELSRHYVSLLSTPLLMGLPLAIVACNALQEVRLRVSLTVGETLLNLLIVLWIHRAVYRPDDTMGRFLNWRPCRYVGRLSYSLYIWQQIFLNRSSDSLLTTFPANLLCAALTGMASYYLVETPFLEWRSRLEKAWRTRSSTNGMHNVEVQQDSGAVGGPLQGSETVQSMPAIPETERLPVS